MNCPSKDSSVVTAVGLYCVVCDVLFFEDIDYFVKMCSDPDYKHLCLDCDPEAENAPYLLTLKERSESS